MTKLGDELRLKYIEKDRQNQLNIIEVAQAKLADLNMQRQNLIMSQEES